MLQRASAELIIAPSTFILIISSVNWSVLTEDLGPNSLQLTANKRAILSFFSISLILCTLSHSLWIVLHYFLLSCLLFVLLILTHCVVLHFPCYYYCYYCYFRHCTHHTYFHYSTLQHFVMLCNIIFFHVLYSFFFLCLFVALCIPIVCRVCCTEKPWHASVSIASFLSSDSKFSLSSTSTLLFLFLCALSLFLCLLLFACTFYKSFKLFLCLSLKLTDFSESE